MEKPLLYLSAFFERNKSLYYDNLTRVREKNDMLQWLRYFLTGIAETATKAVTTLSAVMELKSKIEQSIQGLGRRSHSALKLITHMFKDPVVTAKKVEDICGLSTKAANELVTIFIEKGWLKKIGESERYRTFVFEPYLTLFEKF